MKKILFIALMAFSLSTQAQTVKKDTAQGYTYASIADVAVWPATATRISIRIVGDNLDKESAAAVFYYELRSEVGDVVRRGNITIAGADYTSWDANSLESTYDMVCDKLKLTIVD